MGNFVKNPLTTILSGYTVGSNTAIAATDTILAAFKKIQAQINTLGVNKFSSGNLIRNGFCETGANDNFGSWTIDPVFVPSGATKSFLYPSQISINEVALGDDLITCDASKLLKMSWGMCVGDINGSNVNATRMQYVYIKCYDGDGNKIEDWNANPYPGAVNTTLALPLQNGDTTVTLTDGTGWASASDAWYSREFVWWPYISGLGIYGYQEASGRVHAQYTYPGQINVAPAYRLADGITTGDFSGTWSNRAGNVLTLNPLNYPSGWTRGTIPAGTPIKNTTGTGSQIYLYNATTTGGWISVEKTFTTNTSLSADKYLYAGTAKVAIKCHINNGGSGTGSKVRYANIYLRQA